MNKFLFKSSEPDLPKMLSILETLQKNILYLTYTVDTILKILKEEHIDKDLQKQVDQYFEDETSPQTDTDDKEPD